MTIDRYTTHIPAFRDIFAAREFDRILEFGLGHGSTPFLLENCSHLTSVEMQSEEWYERVVSSLGERKNWKPIMSIGPFGFLELPIFDQPYDLVFADGHGDSRPEVISKYSGLCDTIVTHDFETPSYRWNLINLDDSYKCFVYKALDPWTAVFTRDSSLMMHLSKIDAWSA